jgi:GxxExxY protein
LRGVNEKIPYQRQKPIPVVYDGQLLKMEFRADILVDDKVIVEIKSVECLLPIHHKILLSYLKLSKLKLGLLVNFHEVLVKDGLVRLANGL